MATAVDDWVGLEIVRWTNRAMGWILLVRVRELSVSVVLRDYMQCWIGGISTRIWYDVAMKRTRLCCR